MSLATKILPLICLAVALNFSVPARAASPTDPNKKALQELLDELRIKIKEADKRMIAHPRFLDELRALVDKYQKKLRQVFLEDDFSDGDYTDNPTWVVKAGRFWVTGEGRLKSRIAATPPAESKGSKEEESAFGAILKEVLKTTGEGKQTGREPEAVSEAIIYCAAGFDSSYEVDISFVSTSQWGAMEVELLGGDPPVPRYKMIYHAKASSDRPIQIVRLRGSKSYLIEEATRYPALDDGDVHRIQWSRYADGQMRVLVDGEEVLSTVELYYRTPFSGLALTNRGGTYEWDSVRVLKVAERE